MGVKFFCNKCGKKLQMMDKNTKENTTIAEAEKKCICSDCERIETRKKRIEAKKKAIKMKKCKEKGCDGELDKAHPVVFYVPTIIVSLPMPMYVCKKCKRLHHENGSPLRTRAGRAFWLKEGEILYKKKNRVTKTEKLSDGSFSVQK